MKISVDGAMAIIRNEAIVLETYLDTGKVKTIGVGHTAAAGGMVPERGDKITVKQALNLFLDDLAKFERRVNRHIKGPLKQHEFDGFVSFDFNTGKIDGGTVDDKWNRGDRKAALATLEAYNKDNGRKLAGLVARRSEERSMIENGDYPPHDKIRIDAKFGKPVRWPESSVRELLQQVMKEREGKPLVDAPAPDVSIAAPEQGRQTQNVGKALGGGLVAGGAVVAATGFDWKWLLASALVALAAGAFVFVMLKGKKP